MPEALLTILKFCFLALLWLFFVRVLRVAWVEVTAPPTPAPAGPGSGPGPGRAVSTDGADAARLRIVEPSNLRGRTYDLGQEATLGRAGGCQVALAQDTYVSQLHARIYRRDGRLWLEDLDSTNGTYVNAKKISAPVVLRRGDRVQVGRTVLEVSR